ncbi:class I SAM-dependent methyltransferase [Noviherbaspirillum sp.]|uniref:class I SAM-dependent methyltransferase n=1 Tax=Noviherbaspirillum sp. TaxID=1926288 RepID=UPI002FE18ED9
MQAGRASITALRAARSRAKHQLCDFPPIFEDPIALKILGLRNDAELRAMPPHADSKFARGIRAGLVARSRIAEDELHQAVKRGVPQYVVLGAGLDTFAYRNPYPASTLRVFEVDHPATQAWKRTLLDEAQIPLPDSLRFVDIDFESQSLAERLHAAGFNAGEPAFFSWLGVTMYLSNDAVMHILRHVASGPKGSGIVFDYVLDYASRNLVGRLFLHALAYRFARLGEPWIGFFQPHDLMTRMKAMGFAEMEDIGTEQLNERFFMHRQDNLKFSEFGLRFAKLGHVMVARV